jgi:predicted transcriptional regulator
MRKLMKYSRAYGGSDPELIEGDVFKIMIRVPEFSEKQVMGHENEKPPAEVSGQVSGQVTGQVSGQVEPWVLKALTSCSEPNSSAKIQSVIGIKHRETFQRNYLDYLLSEGFLERTIPDKPKSRLQKYRLTRKGKALVEKHHV